MSMGTVGIPNGLAERTKRHEVYRSEVTEEEHIRRPEDRKAVPTEEVLIDVSSESMTAVPVSQGVGV